MYRVKLYHLRRNVKFVIMNSVYYTDKYLQSFYDLKGSTFGRDAKPGDAVKKDNDLRRGLPDSSLALRPAQRAALRGQLVSDCKFLEREGVMDYSMLVGVHHIPVKEQAAEQHMGFRGARPRLNSAASASARGTDADASDSENSGLDITPTRNFAENQQHAEHGRHALSLSETIGAFFYENGLDEDDSSYLDGVGKDGDTYDGNDRHVNEATERKKQATIEKLYWPFHRYFDIHGHRLVHPATCVTCKQKPCRCSSQEDKRLLKGYKIPAFVPPISNRKDGGLEMDTTGLKLPLKYKSGNDQLKCNGKIFFMGVIDILQEYSSRKVLESTYRSFTSHGMEASCVAPHQYGDRFVNFFDDYTQPVPADQDNKTQKSTTKPSPKTLARTQVHV